MTFDVYRESRELLLESLPAESIRHWLVPLGFENWEATHRRLLRIASRAAGRRSFGDLLPHLLTMLSETGNPDHVLVNLERFIEATGAAPEKLHYLATHLRAMEILVKLFSGSQFLTEILLRNPEYFDVLAEHHRLAHAKTV
ncbi:MAG: hypothetical protein MUQ30_01025, partial [Anaerolineae bacterium]|nr:hypothetical protein [Anaerolineae bacterium]